MHTSLKLSILERPAGDQETTAEHVFGTSGGTLGRSRQCDWVFLDPERFVSSVHAEVVFRHPHFFLVDRSTNGVFINQSDEQLGKGQDVCLEEGYHIRFGGYDLLVQLIETEAAALEATSAGATVGPESTSEYSGATQIFRAGDLPAVKVARPPPESGEDALALVLGGLGLPADSIAAEDSAEFLETVGMIVRESVGSLTEVLAARARVKTEFHAAGTQPRANEQNALKLVHSTDDALKMIFLGDREGMLSPLRTVQASFRDIKRHQQGMVGGMKAGLAALVKRFDPGRVEARMQTRWPRWVLFLLRHRMWEEYRTYFRTLTAGDLESVYRIFGEDFSSAYDRYSDHDKPPV